MTGGTSCAEALAGASASAVTAKGQAAAVAWSARPSYSVVWTRATSPDPVQDRHDQQEGAHHQAQGALARAERDPGPPAARRA